MAEYTITTTDAQEATLTWYMTQLYPEPPLPLAAVHTWMQAQIDATIRGLAGQKLGQEVQALSDAYKAMTPTDQADVLPQLRTLLGLE